MQDHVLKPVSPLALRRTFLAVALLPLAALPALAWNRHLAAIGSLFTLWSNLWYNQSRAKLTPPRRIVSASAGDRAASPRCSRSCAISC